ncbi:MAG: hypothetical protein ABEH81_16300 [Halopenitus sp.]
MAEHEYAFDGLPLSAVRPGMSILVAGSAHAGARELGLRLLAAPADEAAILITTNQRAVRIADDCRRVGLDVSEERTAIIDCVGGEESDADAKVLPVSGPSDLTGIGMRYSDVYRSFVADDRERVRTGLHSLSTLVSFGDLKNVSRFLHTLVGRIDAVDGLGVFQIDPTNHDDRTVSTLAQFCSARVDVREGEEGPEFRARGIPGQSREWTGFDPDFD